MRISGCSSDVCSSDLFRTYPSTAARFWIERWCDGCGICPARHARGFNRISLIGLIADPLDPASEHAANLRARRNVHQDVDVRTAEWAVLPNPYPGKLASTLTDPIAGELQKLARGGCGPVVRDSGALPMHRHIPVERTVYPVCIANRVANVSSLPHRKDLAPTVRSVAGSTPFDGSVGDLPHPLRSEERRGGKAGVSTRNYWCTHSAIKKNKMK